MRKPTPFLTLSHVVVRVLFWLLAAGAVFAGLITAFVAFAPFEIMKVGDRFTDAQAVNIVGIGALALGAAAAMLWPLTKLLGDARVGRIFTLANVRRLRLVALMMVASQIIASGVMLYYQHMGAGLAPSDMVPSLSDLFSAVLCLALAEVFAYGVALQDDAEGTV